MYIYKTVCKVNGKIYIGQCSRSPELSKSYLGSGLSFSVALKKYGRENFAKEVLRSDIESQKQLDIWEQIYIKKFDSCNRKIGYNILPGSANGFKSNPAHLEHAKEAVRESNRKRVWTEDGKARATAHLKNPKSDKHKINIAKALRGKSFSEERKLNIGKSLKGRKPSTGFSGRTHSEESKAKTKQGLALYWQNKRNKNG